MDIEVEYIWYPVPNTAPEGPVTVFTDRNWDDRDHWWPPGVGVVPRSQKPYFGPIPPATIFPVEGTPDQWVNGFSYADWIANQIPPGPRCIRTDAIIKVARLRQAQDLFLLDFNVRTLNEAQDLPFTFRVALVVTDEIAEAQDLPYVSPPPGLIAEAQDLPYVGTVFGSLDQVQDLVGGGSLALSTDCLNPVPLILGNTYGGITDGVSIYFFGRSDPGGGTYHITGYPIDPTFIIIEAVNGPCSGLSGGFGLALGTCSSGTLGGTGADVFVLVDGTLGVYFFEFTFDSGPC